MKKNKEFKVLKHITISTENYEKLKNLGRTSDSFNDVITNILEKIHPLHPSKEIDIQ